MTQIGEPDTLDSMGSWVSDALEPAQLTASTMRFGRRKLSRGTLFLLWALRFYAVFMVVIIGLAVWNALYPAG